MALGTHELKERAAKASEWLRRHASACSDDQLRLIKRLLAQGVNHIRVVPMFLGVGKHVRHDLPEMMAELKEQHPSVVFECQPAVGEHPDLLDLLARIAVT